jgi:NADH:ubiquinone oxidoreductase subunit 4 (subunit M)
MFKNPFLLALISAVSTSCIGYLINQLPEIPNKTQNSKWIFTAVIVITLVVWILAVLQNQFSIKQSNLRTVVRRNWLIGSRNKLAVRARDAEISENQLIGKEQELIIGSELGDQPQGNQ